jgi:hypothetical protein
MCCKAKIAAFLVLLVFAIPAAEAADEESDEAECTLGSDSGVAGDMGTSPSKLIQLAAHGPKGQIFVADGASTQWGDTSPLCGTGGCPIGVFPVKDGVTTIIMRIKFRVGRLHVLVHRDNSRPWI